MSDFEVLYSAGDPPPALTGERFDADQLATFYPYPDPIPERGWVRGSMLSTVDGSVTGPDALAGSISGPPDRILLATLRHTADAVLVGIGTARAEGYRRIRPRATFAAYRAAHGQPVVPTLAVVTNSGEVPESLLERDGDVSELLVLVSTQTPADRVRALRSTLGEEAVIVAGEAVVEPDAAVAALVARGLCRIDCEGGPRWLANVAAAGRLDDLCLTTSPLLVGTGTGQILQGAALGPDKVSLQQVLLSDDMLFTRWLVHH